MKKRELWLLMLIMLLGFFLRVINVSSLPAILNRDEAALGYNAWLLAQTGHDEWQRPWPVALESFGDFKLIGYPLTIIFTQLLFGVSDLAVRLPSVLAGTILIGLAYYFGQQFLSRRFSLVFALLVALSPVFFFYSRMAYEANVALTYVVGLLLIIFANRGKHFRVWWDLLGIILASLAVFTYNSPLLLLPLIILSVPIIRGWRQPHQYVTMVLGLSLIFMVAFSQLLSLTAQKQGITIFSDESTLMTYPTYREQWSGVMQSVVGNKYAYFIKIAFTNTLNSFSPKYLVTQGGSHPWHTLPNHGHLYWFEYGLGLIGIMSLLGWGVRAFAQYLSTKQVSPPVKNSPLSLTKVGWLLALLLGSLLPAVITVDAPHATRTLLFFFLFTLLSVIALELTMKWLSTVSDKRSQFRSLGVFLTYLLIFGSITEVTQYFSDYYTVYPTQQARFMAGFNEVLALLPESEQPIAIIDPDGYHYILAAWYQKMPPDYFSQTVVRQQANSIGFKYGEQVGTYHFFAQKADVPEQFQTIVFWNGEAWRAEVR